MISGEDESSSVLNGRLRPRKTTAIIPNPLNKSTYKLENKVAQDKPKRNSTPSKASPNKQDDLTAKADPSLLTQLLCPYCDRKFTTKLSVSKHARRIHLSTSKQDNFINCLFCNHSEAESANIIRHMVDSHPNQYFACLDCNTRFFSTSELAEHKLNVCEKQKQAYRSKLRQKTSSLSKKEHKKVDTNDKNYSEDNKKLEYGPEFNGVVISCELKPSHGHDAVDIEDNITTNLILPSNIGNTVLEKNAVIILDDIQWNRRLPPNFSFRNADADQILSRLGVVHRSPRVGETTRREWLKMIDVTSQKFEKCFDTNFYSRVASNVQQNLARFLDGTFNFSPDPDKVIKTRKSKSSAIINTAEGFPILLPHEQYSRNRFDGYMPRAIAPKHKWKWDSAENEKNIIIDANVMKRDNHVDNCIITLVSSLDIWTQLRMRRKFEGVFCKAATEKIEKQNIIGRELKEILESREIPSTSSQVVEYTDRTADATTSVTAIVDKASEFPSFLGLSARASQCESSLQPAVLSGEWVRPRCYVCCACGDQTRDSRALTAHMTVHHPNAQVQHYEIVGDSLLNADILKHLYVPPSQMPNRTRPLRGFRDCTKCKKSITMEDLHQHMLDCAGDTPTVRRKCRSRPFGVRRRRPRLPDNTMRKKMRKDLRTRHNQKALLRTRPRIRTEVGDAETIRKMIADLPAKRHRQAADNLNTQQVLRPRRKLDKQRTKLKIKRLTSKDTKTIKVQTKNDTNDLSIIDEDDQPLKPKTVIEPENEKNGARKRVTGRVVTSKNKKGNTAVYETSAVNEHQQNTSAGEENDSIPQELSSKSSSQKLNIITKGNDNRGKEDDSNVPENNDNDKKSPDEEQDKDNHKSVVSDPTILKHSINNLTDFSNKASPPQPEYQFLQQPNNGDTAHDKQTIFLENEVGSSLPDKPPIQTNQKRSSEKKRESLLNCIEKIKSQQKGDTMSDHRLNQKAYFPFMDPHPAVISRNRDESGAAKNVVPTWTGGLQEVELNQRENNLRLLSPLSLAVELQRKRKDMLVVASMTEPVYVHKKAPETELASLQVPSGGQRRKSSAARLSMLHNDQVSQSQLAHLYFQRQWNFGLNAIPPTSMVHAHLQQQMEQQRMSLPETLMQQQQGIQPFKINNPAQYTNQNFLPGQYNTTDLKNEGRLQIRNESAPQFFGTSQLHSNILSPSPQSWTRESIQIPQFNNSYNVPVMLQPMAASELVTTRRTPQNRVSESSETDVRRSLEDAAMLNYANMRRMSSDTMYTSPTSQLYKESSHYYNALNRSGAQDVGYDKNADFEAWCQDQINRSTFHNLMNKGSILYRTPQNTAVNNQIFMPRFDVEEHQTDQLSGNQIDNENNENSTTSLYCSNLNNKKLHEGHNDQPIRLSTNQDALITSSSNYATVQKSSDVFTHDQTSDVPVSSNTIIDREKHNSYSEVEEEISENQTEFSSTEEPLDLSVKQRPAMHTENVMDVSTDQTNYESLEVSKITCDKSSRKRMHTEIDTCENIAATIDSFDSDNQIPNKSIDTIEQNIEAEKPTQHKFPRSTVKYYEERNDMEISSEHDNDENSYTNQTSDTSTLQYSYEKYIDNENHDESILTNVNVNVNSEIGSQATEVSASQSSNCDLSDIPNHRPEKMIENLPQALENQGVLKTNEVTAANKIQSNNFSSSDNTESVEQITAHCETNMEQNNTQKDTQCAEAPNENKKISVDDTSANDNVSKSKSSLINQDPETAKKMALLPKELVELLVDVPKEQHNKFVNIITQLIPPANHNRTKPIITVQHPENASQQLEDSSVKSNTSPVSNTLTNTENRLAINTGTLPSSSILPKKRHSPSARPEGCSNMTLLKSSPEPKPQSKCTINSIPDTSLKDNKYVSSENEHATNPSPGTSKISEESDANTSMEKIIDLTDDDVNLKTSPNTLNSNILPFQETVHKLQVTTKSSNEKTASLRAVRIKTSLVRKSDDKQPIKEVISPQSISHQRESEVVYKQFTNESPAAKKKTEFFANTCENQSETIITPQNVVQIRNETAKFISMADCEQVKQLDIGAGKLEKNEIIDRSLIKSQKINNYVQSDSATMGSVMLHSPITNQIKLKNIDSPCNKETTSDNIENAEVMKTESIDQKNTDIDTNLESKICTFDSARVSSKISFSKKNNLHTSPSVKHTNIPDASSLICSEQNHNTANNIILETGKSQIDSNVHDTQQEEVIKNNENSNNILSSKPVYISLHPNLSENTKPRTNFSDDEDSDDDLSLAVIVKQKQQGQTSSSEIFASSSFTDLNNTTKLSKKDEMSIMYLQTTDLQLLTVSRALSNTASDKEPIVVESTNNEIKTNTVNAKENYKNVLESINENSSSENVIKKDETRVTLEKIKNVEQNLFFNTLMEGNGNNDSLVTNEDINVDFSQDLVNKDSSNAKIAGSSKPCKADGKNNSLIRDEKSNIAEILNTSIELQLPRDTEAVSGIKQRKKKFENAETVASVLLNNPDLSSELKETSERALRRSRRGKSMILDNKEVIDHETISTVAASQPAGHKIPVTKKQLIFSKLLLDENIQGKSSNDFQSDLIIKSKIVPVKRKKSPGKTKSKKKKISDSNCDEKCSNTNNLNCTPDIIRKDLSLDSGAIGNENVLEFSDNDSEVHKEKRKSNITLTNDTSDSSKAKRIRNGKNQDSVTTDFEINTYIERNYIDINKEDLKSTQDKSNKPVDNHIASSSGYTNPKKQLEKTGETKTACYNRPITVSKQASDPVKDTVNYDPYDINLDIDMAETTKPIIVKRKLSKAASTSFKTSKKALSHENPVDKIRHKIEIEIPISGTLQPSVSDSDSSISDAPLQKYVEEKEKIRIEGLQSSDCSKPENNSEPSNTLTDTSQDHVSSSEVASQIVKKNVIENNDEPSSEINVKITNNTAPLLSSRDEIDKAGDMSVREDDATDNNNETHQVYDKIECVAESSTTKSNNKQKRNSRLPTSKKSLSVPNETEQQLTSDKCMENFGFFPVRQPRKSNLLASKKISETYHMIENDDAYFRAEDRQRKSSHSENRKTTDGDYTLKVAQAQSTAPQEAGCSHKKSSTAQLTAPEEVGSSTTAVEQCSANDEDEVDPITAQKMLNSDEIKQMESDVYNGFKKAAQANVGKTSGFNHLRAEDKNPHENNSQDISTPIENDTVVMDNIKSPERPDSPERLHSPNRSESSKTPDSPESLKDKPLMYPEEEVNIYEDKYDIIKRRREASANAKQLQKVEKPKKSRNEKNKKKAERKTNKKITKKPTYLGSQVPTKGALKGFDGIKISILTQDLNMPPNLSPPYHRQRQSRSKKRKESFGKNRTNSGSSSKSDHNDSSKVVCNPDVYEFQDDERPVTKGYTLTSEIDRCRNLSSENEDKPVTKIEKEKKSIKIIEKDNLKTTDQEIEKDKSKKWKGKGKGKGKYANNETDKKTAQQAEEKNKQKENPREEKVLCKFTDASKMEQVIEYREKKDETNMKADDGQSNDYKKTLITIQENEEPFIDSDIEDQIVLPSTSGFVPDRNDESSYESYSSSPNPLIPYSCTCVSEIDSDDSETPRGCAHSSCQYSHLNAAKNAVMGKIFRNNAVRCDKSDDTPDDPPKPKPDLDRLFDSLLESTTDNNETPTRNITPVSGPSSATYYFTNQINYPDEALQNNKSLDEKDVSNVDDGFSSPNHRDFEKDAQKVLECASQISPNNTNSLKIDDDSINNFGELTNVSIDNEYIMVSQKHIQTEDPAQLAASENFDEPMEEVVPKELEQTNSNLKNNIDTSEDSLDNLDKVPESSDYIKLKSKRVEVWNSRGTQTKRSASQSDVEISSSGDELTEAKLAKKDRRAHKKHKSHHKRRKVDTGHSDSKDAAAPKHNSPTQNAIKENGTELDEKQRSNEKISPSRKSDEGISTSHDNSADAYDMAPVGDTGVAVQRARRKCTVGKQNVLAEHWSSSESEAGKAPNRLKGKKSSSGKRINRLARKDRSSRRSREVDADNPDDEAGSSRSSRSKARPPLAKAQSSSPKERSPSFKDLGHSGIKLEQHGWIVGRSHKKLVTLLACSKSKSRPDGQDEIKKDEEEKKEAVNGDDEDEEEK